MKTARYPQVFTHRFLQSELFRELAGQLGDALRMAAQIEVFGFHGVDQRLGDADRHQSQGLFLPLQLGGA